MYESHEDMLIAQRAENRFRSVRARCAAFASHKDIKDGTPRYREALEKERTSILLLEAWMYGVQARMEAIDSNPEYKHLSLSEVAALACTEDAKDRTPADPYVVFAQAPGVERPGKTRSPLSRFEFRNFDIWGILVAIATRIWSRQRVTHQ